MDWCFSEIWGFDEFPKICAKHKDVTLRHILCQIAVSDLVSGEPLRSSDAPRP